MRRAGSDASEAPMMLQVMVAMLSISSFDGPQPTRDNRNTPAQNLKFKRAVDAASLALAEEKRLKRTALYCKTQSAIIRLFFATFSLPTVLRQIAVLKVVIFSA